MAGVDTGGGGGKKRATNSEINMIPPTEKETLYYAQAPDLAEAGSQ